MTLTLPQQRKAADLRASITAALALTRQAAQDALQASQQCAATSPDHPLTRRASLRATHTTWLHGRLEALRAQAAAHCARTREGRGALEQDARHAQATLLNARHGAHDAHFALTLLHSPRLPTCLISPERAHTLLDELDARHAQDPTTALRSIAASGETAFLQPRAGGGYETSPEPPRGDWQPPIPDRSRVQVFSDRAQAVSELCAGLLPEWFSRTRPAEDD